MVSGVNELFGLPVHKLVVVEYALDIESVVILHPPMVVRTVKERKLIDINVTEKLVLVRKQQICQCIFIKVYTVDSGWGSWTLWSSCSAICGGRQRTRKRFCIPSEGISDCDGFMEHTVVCNNISCPGEIHVHAMCTPYGWSNAYKSN